MCARVRLFEMIFSLCTFKSIFYAQWQGIHLLDEMTEFLIFDTFKNFEMDF